MDDRVFGLEAGQLPCTPDEIIVQHNVGTHSDPSGWVYVFPDMRV